MTEEWFGGSYAVIDLDLAISDIRRRKSWKHIQIPRTDPNGAAG
jgi:hypothetical protein